MEKAVLHLSLNLLYAQQNSPVLFVYSRNAVMERKNYDLLLDCY